MEKRTHWHCVYDLQYHLVLVTKYRRKCLNKQMRIQLKNDFSRIAEFWDCELREFGAEEDHVHLLFAAHPSLDLSRMINNWKTVTSRNLRKNFSKELEKYYSKTGLWTRAYCLLSSGGATIETIRNYIQKQAGN